MFRKQTLTTYGNILMCARQLMRRNQSSFVRLNHEELRPAQLSRLEGRQFLPGADKNSFPERLAAPRKDFPLALAAVDGKRSLQDWAKLCRQEIDANLLKYGAILFRELPLSTVEDFQQLFEAMDYQPMDYKGGSGERIKMTSDVYTASDEPAEYSIELHNELSYNPVFCKKIFFFCANAAESGGETAICKNSEVFPQLEDKYVQKARRKRIRYLRQSKDKSIDDYISWQKVFHTDCKKEAEDKMRSVGFEWEWSSDGKILKFWCILDAFTPHHETGEEVWFNQIHSMNCSYYTAHPAYHGKDPTECFFTHHSTYGDGEEFEPEFLQQIRTASWACAVGMPLRQGDFIVLDNMQVQHSRLAFTGNRKITVAMAN
eukprot:gene16845-18544_t